MIGGRIETATFVGRSTRSRSRYPLPSSATTVPSGCSASGCWTSASCWLGSNGCPSAGDRLDAVLGQGGEQLLVDQLEPLADPRGGRGAERLGGTLEVVEAVEQVARQRADRVLPIGVGLRPGPLLVVGELGAAPLELVEVLVALRLHLAQLVGRRAVGVGVWRWRCPAKGAVVSSIGHRLLILLLGRVPRRRRVRQVGSPGRRPRLPR